MTLWFFSSFFQLKWWSGWEGWTICYYFVQRDNDPSWIKMKKKSFSFVHFRNSLTTLSFVFFVSFRTRKTFSIYFPWGRKKSDVTLSIFPVNFVYFPFFRHDLFLFNPFFRRIFFFFHKHIDFISSFFLESLISLNFRSIIKNA